jgi:hypothetical protein
LHQIYIVIVGQTGRRLSARLDAAGPRFATLLSLSWKFMGMHGGGAARYHFTGSCVILPPQRRAAPIAAKIYRASAMFLC